MPNKGKASVAEQDQICVWFKMFIGPSFLAKTGVFSNPAKACMVMGMKGIASKVYDTTLL